jgi:hypothetical protein
MHQAVLIAAAVAFAAGTAQAAQSADGAAPAVEAAPASSWTINETSWEFTVDGSPMQESIDAAGNYVINAGTQHIDHGTAVMKDGKVCTTSAMTSEGEVCWTLAPLEVGASGDAVSDKGQKLTVKRVAYAPITM